MAQRKSVEYLKEESRLAHIDHDRLMEYVRSQARISTEDPEEVIEQKQKLQERLTAFEAGFSVKTTKKFKNLTYRVLPAFMEVAGLSYRDVLEITNDTKGGRTEIKWADHIEEQMSNACDDLPTDAAREQVRRLVVAMLPENLRELLYQKAPSAVRAVRAGKCRRISIKDIRQQIKTDYTQMNRYTYAEVKDDTYHSTIPLHTYNQTISLYDVSPHWLLGLDENTCVLAKSGSTELIMDAFCLLPMEWKEVVLTATRLMARNLKGGQ